MGTQTVLQLVQEFCGLKGLPIPAALMGSNATSVVQYRALLNQVLREAISKPWPETKVQASITTLATADQGNVNTLFPGIVGFVKDTIWIETQTIPVRGPLTDSSWAALTALQIAGPPYSFWLGGEHFYLTPTPPAGNTLSAIYTTDYKYFNGTTPKLELTDDQDTTVVPDRVMISGLCAYWGKIKGLDGWKDDMAAFHADISYSISNTLPTLAMDTQGDTTRPRIFIPPGSWMT